MKSFLLLVLITFFSCSNSSDNVEIVNNNSNNTNTSLWCVPESDIAGRGGAFEVMNDPQYKTVSEIENLGTLNDNSRLSILNVNNEIYIYPYDYVINFEVINDDFVDLNLAFSYCPITESALCFNRKLSNNEVITMKASGFLFKDNLVTSDINTKYFWSQMSAEGLRESSKEIRLNTYNIVESTWGIARSFFPDALVFNHPGFDGCDCDETPIPIDFNNLFGVIHKRNVFSDIAHLFNYNNFTNGIELDYAVVNGKTAVVVGSKSKVFFNAFFNPGNLIFEALDENDFPNVLTDNEGNIWNIFGIAVEGPRLGNKLDSPKSYVAAEWAWNAIFEDLEFYN
jgi:hypothetical protein